MKRFFLLIFFVSVVLTGCSDYDSAVPDTPGNRKGFKKLVGIDPGETVKKIYIYADEFFDPLYCIGFETTPERIKEIIHKLGFKEVENISWGVASDLAPEWAAWWKAEDRKKSKLYRVSKEYCYEYYLWYDPSTGKCQLLLMYL